jgi:RPA family protein
MEQREIKRQTAYKTNIKNLLDGVFVKKAGWESNYLMTEYGDFSRVNIIAVVVSKEDRTLVIDDGTGNITVRTFEDGFFNKIQVGDLVIIIGRPRDYNGLYLGAEIIHPIDRRWINYRRKELQLINKVRDLEELHRKRPKEAEEVESPSVHNAKAIILSMIEELDKGEGASVDDVMRFSKIKNGEDVIQELLMRGEIFEFKAGKLKKM